MPRKPQKIEELKNKETDSIKKTTVKKVSAKNAQTSTKIETRKNVAKKSNNTKISKEKKSSITKKITSNKKTKVSQKELTKTITKLDYYDLPHSYNQTVIKILAQTPTTLFIYWDISDEDRKKYEEQYGKNFFNETKPILIIHNNTLHYKFEVEINDFANSWYLHVADSKCDYKIELGRKPIVKSEKINTDYIYITTSNQIESPNNRILFDKNQKMVYFRNVKTNVETSKSINTISFMRNMGKIYDIYDLYKIIYKNENVEEIYNYSNPSSGNPSSQFK